jgi:hypothetical protein
MGDLDYCGAYGYPLPPPLLLLLLLQWRLVVVVGMVVAVLPCAAVLMRPGTWDGNAAAADTDTVAPAAAAVAQGV